MKEDRLRPFKSLSVLCPGEGEKHLYFQDVRVCFSQTRHALCPTCPTRPDLIVLRLTPEIVKAAEPLPHPGSNPLSTATDGPVVRLQIRNRVKGWKAHLALRSTRYVHPR